MCHMRLSIIPKEQLSTDQLKHIESRRADPKHVNDGAVCQCWDLPWRFYAAVDADLGNKPIGLLYARDDKNAADPAWWIDSQFRRKEYGYKTVRLFAKRLRADGYKGYGNIRIVTFGGKYDEPARKLKECFIKCFEA